MASEWLIKFMGAPDTEYVRKASKMWLISAVARIMQPGCQADYVLILEGEQRLGKSTALRILGGEGYRSMCTNLSSKDSMINLRKAWIMEIAELNSFKITENELIKDFISRKEDYYRPPFERIPIEQPRHCVFAGTTNKNVYLLDPTGGSRFWGIPTVELDRKGLIAARDMIWADAFLLYSSGEKWHPDSNFFKLAKKEQEDRKVEDTWEGIIERYIELNPNIEGVFKTTYEILNDILLISVDRQNRGHSMKLADVMKNLNYPKTQQNAKRGYIFKKGC